MTGGYSKSLLGGLEDGPGVGLSTPGLTIPPTTPTPNATQTTNKQATKPKTPRATKSATKAVSRPTRRRPGRPPLPADDRPQNRQTNATVPDSIHDLVTKIREQEGLSTGEVIVTAVEAEFDRLPTLLRPKMGKSMFQTRAARLPHRTEEPERPMSFCLTSADLALLDELVDQFGARSRGHLITVAIKAHYQT